MSPQEVTVVAILNSNRVRVSTDCEPASAGYPSQVSVDQFFAIELHQRQGLRLQHATWPPNEELTERQ